MRAFKVAFITLSLVVRAAGAQQQQPPTHDAQALAKQLSNPVSSLVSVPFQLNWENGVGPGEDTRFVLNFQPVLPFTLNPKTNLIARVILPYVAQPSLVAGAPPTSGFSDILFSAFFSPAQPKGWIWGIGPALSLPVPTEPTLGSGKWGIGPTAVFLKQSGHWTYGALLNHIWSFAGDSDRSSVNQTFLQPFLALATTRGVTYTIQSETTANWEAASGEQWTIPINLMVTKVVKLGHRPMQVGGGAGYFIDTPTGGAEWKIRTVVVLLFPR
jgi:hypothetical protein